MSVCSIEFLLAVMLASALYWWLPGLRAKQLLWAAASGLFVYSLVPDLLSGAVLAGLVVSGYLVARLLQVRPRPAIVAGYVILLLTAFVILKQYDFLYLVLPSSALAHGISVVGLSYLLFRQIHVAVDVMQGQIDRLSPWTYLNYQLNLFGFLAGPIQRYQEFRTCWDRLEPLWIESYDIWKAYLRIFVGVIKIAVLASLCLTFHEYLAAALARQAPQGLALTTVPKLLAMFYIYPIYIYLNFAGYCDIVIAAAGLFGMRMPENFNWPFVSRNMIDYWTRWHRTLGFWIRDYVFTPLYMASAKRWPRRLSLAAFLCYFFALFLTGVWHGSTWNFAIYGLLNGAGVSAAKAWETFLTQRYGRQGLRAYLQSKTIHVLAVIANFHFVCLTTVFFPVEWLRNLNLVWSFFA